MNEDSKERPPWPDDLVTQVALLRQWQEFHDADCKSWKKTQLSVAAIFLTAMLTAFGALGAMVYQGQQTQLDALRATAAQVQTTVVRVHHESTQPQSQQTQ